MTSFSNSSTAAGATIITKGSSVKLGGIVAGGAATEFLDSSTTANATLIATAGTNGGRGGLIEIDSSASGGSARVELFGNGTLVIDPGISTSIGSIEGNGVVFLGRGSSSRNITIGTNNLSTVFSGKIQGNGSIIKVGTGKLALGKGSTYTGRTTIARGSLLATNRSGSATGTGPVGVAGGILGGTGLISGPVTVASTTAPGILAPGSGKKTGTLTLSSSLTLNSLATYKVDLNSTTATVDQTVANGVTINSGAQVSIDDLGTATLTSGTVFTIISNSAATPISGTFSNLADGSTLIVGNNTYLVSYEGGDGNDLTLTVVP